MTVQDTVESRTGTSLLRLCPQTEAAYQGAGCAVRRAKSRKEGVPDLILKTVVCESWLVEKAIRHEWRGMRRASMACAQHLAPSGMPACLPDCGAYAGPCDGSQYGLPGVAYYICMPCAPQSPPLVSVHAGHAFS